MKETRRWMVFGAVGLAWTILLGFPGYKMAWAQGSAGSGMFQSYKKPMPLPDFLLEDLSGKAIYIAKYQGKVMLLNFWATW